MVIRNGSMKVKAPHPTSKVAKVKAPVTRRARLAKVKGPAQGGGWVAKVKSPLSFVGGSLRRSRGVRPASTFHEDSGR